MLSNLLHHIGCKDILKTKILYFATAICTHPKNFLVKPQTLMSLCDIKIVYYHELLLNVKHIVQLSSLQLDHIGTLSYIVKACFCAWNVNFTHLNLKKKPFESSSKEILINVCVGERELVKVCKANCHCCTNLLWVSEWNFSIPWNKQTGLKQITLRHSTGFLCNTCHIHNDIQLMQRSNT